jgi:hypothetical protein
MKHAWVVGAIALMLAGCGGAGGSAGEEVSDSAAADAHTDGTGAADASSQDGRTGETDGCAGQAAPFSEMFDAVLANLLATGECVAGNWEEDFGDACFYGQALLVWQGEETQDAKLAKLGLESAGYAWECAETFNANPASFLSGSDDLLLGLFGLFETYRRYDAVVAVAGADGWRPDGQKEGLAAILGETVQSFDELLSGLGDYVPDFDVYALYTYGNTVVTALFGLLYVEYARTFPEEAGPWVARAEELVEVIRDAAFDPDLGGFRVRPDDPELEIYPNITMMLLLGRLYLLTGDETHLETALQLYDAIQPLKDVEQGSYRSPYSAETMGAKTDDYKTLSSQLYTILAFLTMYECTQDPRWLEEVAAIFGFIDSHLRQGGKLLHHWMDGEVAKPEHLEYYCVGCNFQALYALKYYWTKPYCSKQ